MTGCVVLALLAAVAAAAHAMSYLEDNGYRDGVMGIIAGFTVGVTVSFALYCSARIIVRPSSWWR